ncbi:MAG TPA: polyamine ABC transporter ATP-binding protein [Gammaproteobacteria bacterium]|nr:polyamine ABC transporter ATP-binding protein [Gammaproteobacteria bacterium]|tara:strand:+ start:5671 stop:6768 length:1098 start_codon:yes stop_codon:yes gene_type:complete
MTSDEQNFIEIKGVSKHFGEIIAVDNVDLAIKKGELFSILGASGSGKTTLLRILAGLEIPSQGSILIDGVDMTSVAPYDRPVNIMFQNYALFPHMSVFENIAYGLKKEGLQKESIEEKVQKMLTLVKLEGYENRKPNQLSGGQSQRVALARSLVKEPKVLLLDEPMAALDKKLRQSTQFELMDIHDELGITFVIVTHDQEEAMTLSDRIAIMEQGQFVQIGSPNLIYENPSSKFVADFLGNINLLEAIVTEQNDKEIIVDCAALGGELKFDQTEQANASEMTVALRPEKVMIEKNMPTNDDQSHIKGIVEDFGYFGNLSIYRVKTESGHVIQVSKQNRDRVEQSIKWEDEVYLSWDNDSLMLLGE